VNTEEEAQDISNKTMWHKLKETVFTFFLRAMATKVAKVFLIDGGLVAASIAVVALTVYISSVTHFYAVNLFWLLISIAYVFFAVLHFRFSSALSMINLDSLPKEREPSGLEMVKIMRAQSDARSGKAPPYTGPSTLEYRQGIYRDNLTVRYIETLALQFNEDSSTNFSILLAAAWIFLFVAVISFFQGVA
jgi:hypothetical protein